MSCSVVLDGRRVHRCGRCGATLYIHRLEMGDCSFELDVWAHERPQRMAYSAYLAGLVDELRSIAG